MTYHFSLRNGSGETIEDETLLAGRALDVVLNDVDNNVVTNKLTRVHGFLSTKTVFGTYLIKQWK